jgi:prepilin-type N-terminal cleavage/methylation domain-containing protein
MTQQLRRQRQATGTEAGMTMIEILVGIVLVGILLMGMNALWVAVARQFDDLTLRQKAILRVNGEMERLVEIYTNSAVAVVAVDVTDYATAAPASSASYLATPASRKIHGLGGASQDYVQDYAGATAFRQAVLADGSNAKDVYRQVYYSTSGSPLSTNDDRNLVWLDRNRNIVGQISWTLTPLTWALSEGCNPIGDPCNLLTLFLDYSFRYDGVLDGKTPIAGSPVETITLQTIVGHRR